ncbi:TetR/AcrR family transcriptional regulator [Pelagibius sp. Alg239-R121]|uniref:TetR/AcrR family transcriptional regulator n=1 Tax=Pelagibius sp. Alg239-R121 TaxID=2993448 RepID=UPI0024A69C3C|nr:TetR/AcrR family transcriptional regulator [Pelagibius sp. Alg239-R121]
MPSPLLSKEEVIDRLALAFRDLGYEGTSLTLLSEATGLKKASLYYYFPGGKEEMASVVIEQVQAWFGENVFKPLKGEGTPASRLKKMTSALHRFYDGGTRACILDVFAIGQAGVMFSPHLAAALKAWEKLIAEVVVDAGIDKATARYRAEDALVSIEGALVYTRVTGSSKTFKRILSNLPDRLLAPAA